jgi:hypothetical protein
MPPEHHDVEQEDRRARHPSSASQASNHTHQSIKCLAALVGDFINTIGQQLK